MVSWKGAVEATRSGLVSWIKGSVEAAESGLRSWKLPSDCASITLDSFASYVVDVGKLFGYCLQASFDESVARRKSNREVAIDSKLACLGSSSRPVMQVIA